MQILLEQAARSLGRFSRRAAEAKTPAEVWSLLAGAFETALSPDALAILQVVESGNARLVDQRNIPVEHFEAPAEEIGEELGDRLRAICCPEGGGHADVLPLVSTGDLVGVVVLFSRTPEPTVSGLRLELARALADIAATALGKAYQLEALNRSYTELRASRDILARSEKLRSLGEMAAGVSHDLKSILNGLSLPLQALRREVKDIDPELLDLIRSMEQTVRRGVDTVERLRYFSRQSPDMRVEPVQLDLLIREAADLARPKLQSSPHSLRLELALGTPPAVLVHASEFLTAIVNLLINAIEAYDAPGTITIETAAESGQAVVRVIDRGKGMPAEVEAKIFEPFFTTKGAAGTGLGLAMVYAFVRRYRGTITFQTSKGAGTTFTLCFPPAPEE